MIIAELCSSYLKYRQASCVSSKTLSDYEYHILPFCRYFGDSREISSISYDEMLDFYVFVQNKWKKQGTRYTYLRNTVLLLDWLTRNYGADVLQFSLSRLPKVKNAVKDIHLLTDDEIITLFQACNSPHQWLTARNCAILAVTLGSALRLHEVVNIKAVNVALDERYLSVIGKGNKPRYIAFNALAEYYIREYLCLCPYRLCLLYFIRQTDAI